MEPDTAKAFAALEESVSELEVRIENVLPPEKSVGEILSIADHLAKTKGPVDR